MKKTISTALIALFTQAQKTWLFLQKWTVIKGLQKLRAIFRVLKFIYGVFCKVILSPAYLILFVWEKMLDYLLGPSDEIYETSRNRHYLLMWSLLAHWCWLVFLITTIVAKILLFQ